MATRSLLILVKVRSVRILLECILVSDVFTFDNTYSWLHNKEVEYVVEVMGPYETKLDPVNKQLESLSLRDTEDSNKNVRETIESVNDTDLDMKL